LRTPSVAGVYLESLEKWSPPPPNYPLRRPHHVSLDRTTPADLGVLIRSASQTQIFFPLPHSRTDLPLSQASPVCERNPPTKHFVFTSFQTARRPPRQLTSWFLSLASLTRRSIGLGDVRLVPASPRTAEGFVPHNSPTKRGFFINVHSQQAT